MDMLFKKKNEEYEILTKKPWQIIFTSITLPPPQIPTNVYVDHPFVALITISLV